MEISILGTGHTKFGKNEETIGDLLYKAGKEALENSNLDINSVDGIYISNFSSGFSNQCHLPAVVASRFGINNEIIRIESACAAGGLAFKEASIAIKSGLYKKVLVVGAEKMTENPIETITKILAMAGSEEEMRHGATFPSLYALIARRYFHEFGANEEHLAKVAVKNHKNALYNPLAQFNKKISVEDVMNSRVIASPLKLLDCSPVSDGGAALLLCNNDIASKYCDTPIFLKGIGHDVDSIELLKRENLTTIPSVQRAARKAFQMSKLAPKDVDVAELHDCFTIAELVEMEDLGFCKKGEAKDWIEENRTEKGGDVQINLSGGLKAKGHPIGATGISQVVDVVKQLRGEAKGVQADNPEIGLTCNVGGSGSTCVVSIFTR